MKLYLITHATTQPDSSSTSAQWNLSVKGLQEAQLLAQHPLWDDVECIILGSGTQVRQTVEPTIAAHKLPTWVEGRFSRAATRQVGRELC